MTSKHTRRGAHAVRRPFRRLGQAVNVGLALCLGVAVMASGLGNPQQAPSAGDRPDGPAPRLVAAGIPQAPTVVFAENFETGTSATASGHLESYSNSGITYTADPYWLNHPNCNGLTVAYNSTVWGTDCSNPDAAQARANERRMADVLGQVAAGVVGSANDATPVNGSTAATRTNHAVAEWTTSVSGSNSLRELETSPLNLSLATGRYISFSIDAVEASCAYLGGANNSRFDFYAVTPGSPVKVNVNPLRPCTDPSTRAYTSPYTPEYGNSWGNGGASVRAGRYFLDAGLLISPTQAASLQVRIRNLTGSSDGNDHAFDNLRVVDVTPTLDKAFSPALVGVGEDSTLTLTVTNTSELGAKANFAFTDTLPVSVVLSPNPGATTTCGNGTVTATAGSGTISLTGGDLATGQNSCTVSVKVRSNTEGTYVNGPSNVTLTGLNPPQDATLVVENQPSLTIDKRVVSEVDVNGNGVRDLGDRIRYEFSVTNTGNVTLHNVSINDAKLAASGITTTCSPDTLAQGATVVCTAAAPYTISQADVDAGSADNTATAQGTATGENTPTVSQPDSTSRPITQNPAIDLVKTADRTDLVAGQTITYTMTATNTGNVTLTGVAITEGSFTGAGALSGLTCTPTQPATLAPGQSLACTASYTVTQADVDAGSVANTADVSATAPTGPAVTDTDRVQVPGASNPALTLDKSASLTSDADGDGLGDAGDVITYTFKVTNTGNKTVFSLDVSDPRIGAVSCPVATLAPGESTTCAATYTVTQADVDAGGALVNTATASGTTPGGSTVDSPVDSVTSPLDNQSGLTVVKDSTGQINDLDGNGPDAGDTVRYTFAVTNTGNVTVTGITVSDPKISQISCPATTLAPGATMSCDGTYTLTATDVTQGEVTNTATASGTDPQGGALVSPPGTKTIDVPRPPLASPDTASTPQDVNVTFAPAGNDTPGPDGAALVPGSLELLDPADGTYRNSITIPGEGTYRVNAGGTVTFDPEPGFTGTATTIGYGIADTNGATATSTITVSVTPVIPDAVDDTATTPYGTTVVVPVTGNDTPGEVSSPLDPTTVKLYDPTSGTWVTTLTVAGEGTYTVDAGTGEVTFTPADGFTGATTPVTYRIADDNGTTDTATITITVGQNATAVPDTATTLQDVAVTVFPTDNDTPGTDATWTLSSLVLLDPATGAPVTEVTVPGEGTWTVHPDGSVTFDPVPRFTGLTTPVSYRVTDSTGLTVTSTVTVEVTPVTPAAVNDRVATGFETPVTIDVLANDTPGDPSAPLDPTTVQLRDPADGQWKTTVTTSEGTYTVDPTTGEVTFAPADGFRGTTEPLPYRVADDNGTPTTALIAIDVAQPEPLVANPDTGTTAQGIAITVDPLGNDGASPTGGTLDPTTVKLFDPATGTWETAVAIPGEGSYRVDPTTGEVTFTPEPGFTGAATAVNYQVTDTDGMSAESTISISVTPVVPDAVDDTATTPYNTAVTADVVANDTAGDPGVPLDPTTVKLYDDRTNTWATTLTTPEGTYQVDPLSGAITFAPAPGFLGETTPVTYRIADANGTTDSATLVVTVEYPPAPTASPDAATTAQNIDVTVDLLANDTTGAADVTLVPATVQLQDPTTGIWGSTVTVAGAGTWTVNPDGTVTFDPEPGFTGTTVDLPYRVADSTGQVARSTVTITVGPITPSTTDDIATTPYSTPVTTDVLANDSAGDVSAPLDPSSVRLVDPATGDPVTVLVVAGEGTWTVNPDGTITFTPAAGFEGTATQVTYQVDDTNGTTAVGTLTVTVGQAPRAEPDAVTTLQNGTVTVDPLVNDTPGTGATLDPSTVLLADPATGDWTTSVTISGEGTWTVDPATGAVTFDPEPGFTGGATVTYQVTDSDGNTATSTVSVTVTPVTPVAADDTATTPYSTAVTVPVLGNDTAGDASAPLVPSSVRLVDPATGDPVTVLVVAGEGTWTVNPDGTITFTPAAGFEGTATPVTYQVADTNGTTTSATVTVTVGSAPVALPDEGTTLQNVPTTLSVLDNDTPGTDATFGPSTVVLVDPTTGAPTTELVVSGEGTWTVNPDGTVTFDPEPWFTGDTTPVSYQVSDSDGNTAEATLLVHVTPVTPVAAGDIASTPYSTPVTTDVLANDSAGDASAPLVPSSVLLVDPATGNPVTVLVVAGEGTWTVNPDGTITFTPAAGFEGTATPVTYQVADTNGTTTSATVTVTVGEAPQALPDSASTVQNTPVTLTPLHNDSPGTGATLDAGSLVLLTPGTGSPVTELVVPGEGTWTVNPDGTVMFTPVPQFTGQTPPVDYQVTDSFGNTTGSTLTVTVAPVVPTAVDDSGSTDHGVPVTIDVLDNDHPGTTCDTVGHGRKGVKHRGTKAPASKECGTVPLDPGTVLLVDPATGELATSVVVPGEGTWTVNADGTVTFTPVKGFSGETTPVTYQVSDVNGTPTTAEVSVTVQAPAPPPAPTPTSTPPPSDPETHPHGPLANTGGPALAVLVLGALALAGGVLLVGARRSRREH
jgi:uncharacterized repeat protein (TIGR01451 family)